MKVCNAEGKVLENKTAKKPKLGRVLVVKSYHTFFGTDEYHYAVYERISNPDLSRLEDKIFCRYIFCEDVTYDKIKDYQYWVPSEFSKKYKECINEVCKKHIVEVYPEVLKAEFSLYAHATYKVFNKKVIYSCTLDDIIDFHEDVNTFHGWRVKHDVLGTGILNTKGSRPVVRWRNTCGNSNCSNRISFYTMSGCHHGAWCYVCTKEGGYLADLRNQYVICDKCSKNEKI